MMRKLAMTLALIFSIAMVGASSKPEKNVTFSKEVAPILFKSCAECHRPGEAAPFSVLSYKDTRPWSKSIREKVLSREMPPWHADPKIGVFSNDRRLSEAEIKTIAAWVDSGSPEGDPKQTPPAPQFVDGWTIGKPDLVIPIPEEFTLAASGPDEYQYFEVQTNFKEDVFVQAAEARPGNRAVVHHIIAFVQPVQAHEKGAHSAPRLSKEEIEKMREKMEKESIFYRDGFLMRTKKDAPVFNNGCETPSGGAGARADGTGEDNIGLLLCGYAPGMNQAKFDNGTVKRVPAGARILFQLHYSKTTGKVEKDRSSIGLVFAKNPPQKELLTHGVSNNYFLIPPGAENQKVTACWTTKDDIHITTLMPHMHLRGKAMEIRAFYPDGRKELLLDVPAYSFSWQTVYYLKEPKGIPKGTRLEVAGYFDNSAKNKYNPDPTQTVRFGEPTYDDMMIGWIDYTVDSKPLRTSAMK
jgi:cytochrome c553